MGTYCIVVYSGILERMECVCRSIVPTMKSSSFQTQRLVIRPWNAGDAAWYIESIDHEVIRWTRESGALSPDDWWDRVNSLTLGDEGSSLCIEDRHGSPVGSLGIWLRDDEAELSYWVDADHRGNGYAAEALAGALEWLSGEQPGSDVMLEIHPQNAASIAVAETAGFTFDGTADSCAPCADDNGQVSLYRRPA